MNNDTQRLNRSSAAFALSAAATVIFNTVLAWVKDAYDPLNQFMASLLGHHWISHAVFDIAFFIILGLILMSTGVASRINPLRLPIVLFCSVVVAGLGLVAWFVFF
ncbi:MAG: hypothetical protein P4L87_12620 [Formivibrio sp.]|nr:hypothetical protein [Formivibrio sp.]